MEGADWNTNARCLAVAWWATALTLVDRVRVRILTHMSRNGWKLCACCTKIDSVKILRHINMRTWQTMTQRRPHSLPVQLRVRRRFCSSESVSLLHKMTNDSSKKAALVLRQVFSAPRTFWRIQERGSVPKAGGTPPPTAQQFGAARPGNGSWSGLGDGVTCASCPVM